MLDDCLIDLIQIVEWRLTIIWLGLTNLKWDYVLGGYVGPTNQVLIWIIYDVRIMEL